MKRKLLRLFFFLAIPNIALALCSNAGTTLVYVNGITTSLTDAQHDLSSLEKVVEQSGIKDVYLKNGYNPTHLDGLGDDIESISQAFNTPISDYDLYTILTQIANEVTTRKLLLVGHSQGTFYTNEIYQYLTQNGVPTSSLAVYNIGTPANFVAGNGSYLTSTNDKVINTVRTLESEARAPLALPANITIPQEPGYAEDTWGGHIPSVYVNGAPDRIAADIQKELGKLSSNESNVSGSCIEPPPIGLSYKFQKSIFSMVDPVVPDVEYAAVDARSTVASVLDNTNDILHTAFSDVIFSVIPKPTAQSASGAFAVEKALYGSSLSVADYDALVNGEDIPQVEPASPYQPAPKENASSAQPVQSTPTQSIVEPIVSVQPTTAVHVATATPPVVQPSSPVPISISPGFGGGAPAPIQVAVSDASTVDASGSPPAQQISNVDSTSSDQTSVGTGTSTVPDTENTPPDTEATPTDATSTETSTQAGTSTNATTTQPDYSILAQSLVTDSFDMKPDGWTNQIHGWSAPAWSTSTSDCYSGGCLVETTFNQQYLDIKKGDALNAGSFVVSFRNSGYLGTFGVGVCIYQSTGCQSPASIGGLDALLADTLTDFIDNTWHRFYFAFEDGTSTKQFCDLFDDADPADCTWQSSTVPNGTIYSGVMLFTANGMNRGASFDWDELRAGGVQ